MMQELLGVDEVAAYLDIHPMTVYRWCRAGRLPALKVGKAWRVPRPALEEFLRRGARPRTLVGHLQAFLTTPDHVIGVATTPDLLHRFDAAFLQVGEARGGVLVKVYTGEPSSEDELRAAFTRHGLAVARLEEEGRLRFTKEADPRGGRAATLRRLLDAETAAGRSLWAAFDWVEDVDLDTALRQQHELRELIHERPATLATGVIERVMDDWSLHEQRRARHAHHGFVSLSATHAFLGRSVPLPAG
jgi:excisionase family DNA binding protein